MKQKIYVKRINEYIKLPKVIDKGDWIDLQCSETTKFKAPQSGVLKTRTVNGVEEKYRNVTFDLQYIPLGIAMRVPSGFEAHVLPRSSTAKGMGLIQANSMGIIDETYSSNTDEWKFPAIALRDTTIKGTEVVSQLDSEGLPTGAIDHVNPGERICQFRIELSQKATFWQKLKWLLSSGIEIVEVDDLGDNARGGFGSTGK